MSSASETQSPIHSPFEITVDDEVHQEVGGDVYFGAVLNTAHDADRLEDREKIKTYLKTTKGLNLNDAEAEKILDDPDERAKLKDLGLGIGKDRHQEALHSRERAQSDNLDYYRKAVEDIKTREELDRVTQLLQDPAEFNTYARHPATHESLLQALASMKDKFDRQDNAKEDFQKQILIENDLTALDSFIDRFPERVANGILREEHRFDLEQAIANRRLNLRVT